MRKIVNLITYMAFAGCCMISCDLDKYPITDYNEFNVIEDDGDTDVQYQTREDILGALNSMYNNIKSQMQECGYEDFLVSTDSRTDNGYSGAPGDPTLITLETFTHDAANSNVSRDWNYYLGRVNDANQIISYIDDISDPTLTDSERNQWKAEALIWRAFNWFEMSLLWGDVPMLDQAPPAITAENIEEVYPLYYPSRTEQLVVFNKIVEDVEWAIRYAPDVNPADKFVASKALGNGLLARVYAEKPIRDYAKVIQYCQAVEAMNLQLVNDFAQLWSWDENRTDMYRHTSESIFEVPFTRSQGNWVWMMFWRNGLSSDLNDSFSWQKWCTPTRNLISHYQREGDEIRMNQTIIWDECGWSTYYPADNYPFMYKCRSNAASMIRMRLAEIYLLHAEALAQTGNLSGAASYVNRVRNRVNLPDLTASATSSKENMINAILDERRLELAFEGHRWFDLVRLDKAIECVNNLNNPSSRYYDSYKPDIRTIDEQRLVFPVPEGQMENNPSLEQNPGY